MTLLRLFMHFGVRRGLALWLLPELRNNGPVTFVKGSPMVEVEYHPDPTHETWTGV